MVRRSDKYNSEPFGTPKRRSNDGSAVGALLAIVLFVVTVSLSVVLLIAYLTPHVAPSTFGSIK